MHLFGLTGGIASGKSAVAARFARRGVPVVDADKLAREVVLPETDGLAAIVATFGTSVLCADGSLDRQKLGDLVFGDDAARSKLNAIVHPRIAQLGAERAAELAARGEPVACYEAALLVENGLSEAFRPLVVVAAAPHVQAGRVEKRDGLDRARAEARIAAQMPLAEKVRVADVTVRNEGTLEELEREADRALREVLEKLKVPTDRYFPVTEG